MQHNHYDFLCDSLIKFTIRQVMQQNHQSIKYFLWQKTEDNYQRAAQQYSNNLDLFKHELLSIVDQYWESGQPNAAACKILGKIFTCIQSIEDIESGKKAFQDLNTLCLLISKEKNLAKLYKKSLIIQAKLAYYFANKNGILIKTEISSLFSHHKDFITIHMEKINNDIKDFIKNIIHKKYIHILNNKPELSPTLKNTDEIQEIITQYHAVEMELASLPFYEYKKYADLYYHVKTYEEYLKDYYYQEALNFNQKDGWPLFAKVKDKAKSLMQMDERKYLLLEKKN